MSKEFKLPPLPEHWGPITLFGFNLNSRLAAQGYAEDYATRAVTEALAERQGEAVDHEPWNEPQVSLASVAPQPAPAQQQGAEQIDAIACERYKVVPSHESMFHRWAVVAGDGTRQLYIGREVECQNMARKFAGAFLDGAYFASHPAPAQPAEKQKEAVPDGVWEALQRMIEDGINKGPASRDDAMAVSRWRARFVPARDGLAAPQPAQQQGEAVAAGWKLVPVEPTEAMMNAALDCDDADPEDGASGEIYATYKVMVKAAPAQQPLTDGQIKAIFDPRNGSMQGLDEVARRFARAIEAAHGIGGEKP